MFSKTIDNKSTFTDVDGNIVVNLSESIFDPNKRIVSAYTLFRVPKHYEMRPDLVSIAMYGSDIYTEMVLKYAMIDNPFSLEKDDLVKDIDINDIYLPVSDTVMDSTGVFDAVKNYHKYIDKSKVPNKRGSDSVEKKIEESGKEPNISKKGDSGIIVKNGKIYFADIDETLKSVDSSIVDCATDGTTLGEFLTATLRNNG